MNVPNLIAFAMETEIIKFHLYLLLERYILSNIKYEFCLLYYITYNCICVYDLCFDWLFIKKTISKTVWVEELTNWPKLINFIFLLNLDIDCI